MRAASAVCRQHQDSCQAWPSHECRAELWLLKRAETGHPLGVAQLLPLASAGGPELSQSSAAADLLVEIGCEELPPADVQAACQQLR